MLDRWSHGSKTFTTPQGTAKFAVAAFVPTALIGTAVAVGGAILAGDIDFDNSAAWLATGAQWWLADAAASLVIGLLFVGSGVLVVLYAYRQARRVWWPRYLRHRAEADRS